VMACAAGKMLHKTGLRMLQIECTGMKRRPSLVFVIEPVWNHNSCVCCIEGK
jgi:hypothetical protein